MATTNEISILLGRSNKLLNLKGITLKHVIQYGSGTIISTDSKTGELIKTLQMGLSKKTALYFLSVFMEGYATANFDIKQIESMNTTHRDVKSTTKGVV